MDILIVEDDWLIADNLRIELIRSGFKSVEAVPSLSRARQLVEAQRPGLALVDVVLGVAPDGLKVASDFAKRLIPVILTTGTASLVPDDLSGAVGLLDKPVRTEDLLGSIAFVMKAATVGALPSELPRSLRLAPALSPDASGHYFV